MPEAGTSTASTFTTTFTKSNCIVQSPGAPTRFPPKSAATSCARWNSAVVLQRWIRRWRLQHKDQRLYCVLKLLSLEWSGSLWNDEQCAAWLSGAENAAGLPVSLSWTAVHTLTDVAEAYDMALRLENDTRSIMASELERKDPTWHSASVATRRQERMRHPRLRRCATLPPSLFKDVVEAVVPTFEVYLEEWKESKKYDVGNKEQITEAMNEIKAKLFNSLGEAAAKWLLGSFTRYDNDDQSQSTMRCENSPNNTFSVSSALTKNNLFRRSLMQLNWRSAPLCSHIRVASYRNSRVDVGSTQTEETDQSEYQPLPLQQQQKQKLDSNNLHTKRGSTDCSHAQRLKDDKMNIEGESKDYEKYAEEEEEEEEEDYTDSTYYAEQHKSHKAVRSRLEKQLNIDSAHSIEKGSGSSEKPPSGPPEGFYTQAAMNAWILEFGELEEGLQLLGFKSQSKAITSPTSGDTLLREVRQWDRGNKTSCNSQGSTSGSISRPKSPSFYSCCAVCELHGRLIRGGSDAEGDDGLVGDALPAEEVMVNCSGCGRAVHVECGVAHPKGRTYCSSVCLSRCGK